MDQPLPHRRKFYFVDNSRDGRLTARAKAHIASESNRQKRLRQVHAFRQKSISKSPEEFKISPETTQASPDTHTTNPSPSTTSTSPISASEAAAQSPPQKRARTVTPPSPLSLVERNLIDMDPFLTMPATMNHSAKYLVGKSSWMVLKAPFLTHVQVLSAPCSWKPASAAHSGAKPSSTPSDSRCGVSVPHITDLQILHRAVYFQSLHKRSIVDNGSLWA